MSTQLQQAIRALRRVWAPKAESFAIGAAADAGFDGGEWSGPAHSHMEQDEYQATLAAVGSRFGLTAEQLEYAIYQADVEQSDQALLKRLVAYGRQQQGGMSWVSHE